MNQTEPDTLTNVLGAVGLVLYAASGILYLVSGLVVPLPWVVVLWAIWIVGIYVLVRVWRTRRAYTALVPIAAALIWWVYVTAGESLLDWTA